MRNLLLALAIGAVAFTLVTLWLGPFAGIVPGVGVFGLAMFLLSRRTGAAVQAELALIGPLLQQRKIAESVAIIETVKAKYGRWQFLLAGQMDAQLGMIEYMQLKFDEARPKLFSGKWRNAVVLVCLGCIDWRRGSKAAAYGFFADAAKASSQDPMVYVVWATLLNKDGEAAKALVAVDKGLKAIAGNGMLRDLRSKIANKKKIDTNAFGESWYQFFPEELAQRMVMRGTRGGPPKGVPQQPQPRHGAKHAPRR